MKKILMLFISVCLVSSLITLLPLAANASANGTCGDDLTWTFKDGTLTISGTGKLSDKPWGAYATEITKLVIEKGVNFIPSGIFMNLTNLKEAQISYTVLAYSQYQIFSPDTYNSLVIKGYTNSCAEEIANNANITFESLGQTPKEIIASGICGENITWSLETYGKLTLNGSGKMYDYNNYYTGNETVPWFNYIKHIKSVTVNENITHIGDYAFYYDFGTKTITTLSLPSTLESIGNYAFYNALSIHKISFPEKLETIGNYAFQSCNVNELVFPDSIRTIGNYAFYRTALDKIDLGNGVRSVGKFAFSETGNEEHKLESVTIPASVENMDSAFCWCYDLKEIILAENGNYKSVDGIVYSKDGKKLIFCPPAIEKLGVVKVCDGTEVICQRAFDNCTKIEAIIIPNSVTTLEAEFASGCDSLKLMYIPKTVKNLQYSSFFSSIWYQNEAIPEIFYGGSEDEWNELMEGLTFQTIFGETTVFHWNAAGIGGACGDNLTWELGGDGTLTISGTGRMYDYEYSNWKTNTPWFIFKDDITSVVAEKGVTGIGTNAFSDCSKIAKVTLPDGIEYIGEYAFDDTAFESNGQNWEGNFWYIDTYLIDYKGEYGAEKSIVIKDGTTCIAGLALYKNFWDCIVIPESVKYIGNDAFYGCDISKVYYAGTEEQWNNVDIGTGNENLTSAIFEYKTITSDGNLKIKEIDFTSSKIAFSVEALKEESDSDEGEESSGDSDGESGDDGDETNDDGVIYVAIYDNDGNLINIINYPASGNVPVELKKEGSTIKIIWWGKTNITPLAKKVDINIK